MNKKIYIVIGLVLLMGCVLFYEDILAVFNGMTVLEGLQFLGNYIIHVAVVTICGFMLVGLPKILKPWINALRWKRLDALKAQRVNRKRRRNAVQQSPSTKVPGLSSVNRMMMSYLLKQVGAQKSQPTTRQAAQPERSHIKLDM